MRTYLKRLSDLISRYFVRARHSRELFAGRLAKPAVLIIDCKEEKQCELVVKVGNPTVIQEHLLKHQYTFMHRTANQIIVSLYDTGNNNPYGRAAAIYHSDGPLAASSAIIALSKAWLHHPTFDLPAAYSSLTQGNWVLIEAKHPSEVPKPLKVKQEVSHLIMTD